MLRHGPGRGPGVVGDQGAGNRQVLAALAGQPAIIAAGLVVRPRYIAEGPKQQLQPGQFPGQKIVAARAGHEVVQAAVEGSGLFDEGFFGGAAVRGSGVFREYRLTMKAHVSRERLPTPLGCPPKFIRAGQ